MQTYAATGAPAYFSTISLSFSLAAPTNSSTFSPFFQTYHQAQLSC